MGSKMPNCLRTAMKRMMTTPMANSSMPWIPMTSGVGGPLRAKPASEGLAPGTVEKKTGTVRALLDWASQQQVFSTEGAHQVTGIKSGWRVTALVCFQIQEST
ncbi:hypothetical protein PBY51_003879 [Eleginops maclovinus]|uniref:Uncharacterized protein n=1 Tax=Eleginops maclovinus TaxID=56733 RepID=A0AAN7Y1Q5_ELEMC|nr:hypothetical protein PBY51_003879 [Eleginops maclovinus]